MRTRDNNHPGYSMPQRHCHNEGNYADYHRDSYPSNHHRRYSSAEVVQAADQYSAIDQESDELIFIKNSYNCSVKSTNTQAAVSLQAGLQLAIALVLRITIFDSVESDAVAQELFQSLTTIQHNKQKIIIEDSKDVKVTTTDTDLAVNIEALLQVLLTLVAAFDVS